MNKQNIGLWILRLVPAIILLQTFISNSLPIRNQ